AAPVTPYKKHSLKPHVVSSVVYVKEDDLVSMVEVEYSVERPAAVALTRGRRRSALARGKMSPRSARWRRLRQALSPEEWRRIGAMGAVVVALHVVGFVLLIVVVAPHHYALGTSGAFTVGIGLTAYTLGLRHAFDADHISAIDNTTRKLMADGKRPL